MSEVEHLSARRRVGLAWGLILLAVLCQFTLQRSTLNFFALVVAAALHEMLVSRKREPWEKSVVRAVCWIVLPILFLLFWLTHFPAEKAFYIFYAVGIPFLVLEMVGDVRWLRTQSNP